MSCLLCHRFILHPSLNESILVVFQEDYEGEDNIKSKEFIHKECLEKAEKALNKAS